MTSTVRPSSSCSAAHLRLRAHFLIANSTLTANPKGSFERAGLPGIFVLAAPGQPVIANSSITP